MQRYPLLIILGGAEVVIGLLLGFMGYAENCDDKDPRWECSDSLESMLQVAAWVVPLLALVYVGPGLLRWLNPDQGPRVARWIVVGLVLAVVARLVRPDTGTAYDWATLAVLYALMAAALGLLAARLVQRTR